ncbi:MAG: (2Fe-2S)-binding protein [Acidobacteria bacterium]|nr:(2Fe-2S)-binding protein [Acidobacteriota bacterium]
MARLQLLVNGKRIRVDIDDGESLLYTLRERLHLTGAKSGCGEGQCGACTVLLNRQPIRACITPTASAGNKPITTIEGLTPAGKPLHPVQQAFLDATAFQCGFCTAAMILGAVALLDSQPKPTDAAIRTSLEGHICRCGTYPRIVEAVRLAAQRERKPTQSEPKRA